MQGTAQAIVTGGKDWSVSETAGRPMHRISLPGRAAQLRFVPRSATWLAAPSLAAVQPHTLAGLQGRDWKPGAAAGVAAHCSTMAPGRHITSKCLVPPTRTLPLRMPCAQRTLWFRPVQIDVMACFSKHNSHQRVAEVAQEAPCGARMEVGTQTSLHGNCTGGEQTQPGLHPPFHPPAHPPELHGSSRPFEKMMLEAVAKSAARAPQRSGSTPKPGAGPVSPNWVRQNSPTKLALNAPMSKNMSMVPLDGKKDSDGTNWAGRRGLLCVGMPAGREHTQEDCHSPQPCLATQQRWPCSHTHTWLHTWYENAEPE